MENTPINSDSIGHHIVADLHGINTQLELDSIDVMKQIVYQAARRAGMNIVGETWKKFDPQGLTGCLLLSASHLTVHFWPEYNFLHLDIFTCGEEGDPEIALKSIMEDLNPNTEKSTITTMDRSIFKKEMTEI